MRFENERTFFARPKTELLKEMMTEVREFYGQVVTDLVDLPEALKPEMIAHSQTPEFLRQQAEYHLRNRYRLPDDIVPELVVAPDEKTALEASLQELDGFTKEVTADVKVPWNGGTKTASFVRIHLPTDRMAALHIPLYGHNQLTPWHHVFGFTSFLDTEGLACGDYSGEYSGKGTDDFMVYRDEDDNIISYSVKYKGDRRPLTPWSHLVKEDLPIIQQFFDRAFDYVSRHRSGEAKISFD